MQGKENPLKNKISSAFTPEHIFYNITPQGEFVKYIKPKKLEENPGKKI